MAMLYFGHKLLLELWKRHEYLVIIMSDLLSYKTAKG